MTINYMNYHDHHSAPRTSRDPAMDTGVEGNQGFAPRNHLPMSGHQEAANHPETKEPRNPSFSPESAPESTTASHVKTRKSKFTSKHTTNRHHFKDKFERKRKANVRACDACATRKVKCETQRPCSHCTSNGLQCTQLRERKKSGPKSLSRYALDSLGVLDEIREKSVVDSIPEETESEQRSPLRDDAKDFTTVNNLNSSLNLSSNLSSNLKSNGSVPPSSGSAHAQAHATGSVITPSATPITSIIPTSTIDYIPTPYYLMENIALLGDEPIVFDLCKPFTVQSFTLNHGKLIEFLNTNYNATQMHQEVNLMTHHDDSVFLSTFLLVLTINLIEAEVLIKLKKQKYKDFLKYPKKNLPQRNFKRFKNLIHMKCIEVFLLIEKNFIVPSIGPPGPSKVDSATANSNHLNSFQVYYNLSLSCLHLCNYYHTLNLTNTLNTTAHMENNFGNEMQEHQKLMYLRKSIAYFQLINLKSSEVTMVTQLHELFEILVTFETFYLIYSSNNYNLNVLRNNDVLVQLDCSRIVNSQSNSFRSFLFQLVDLVRNKDILRRLAKFTNFNILLENKDTTEPNQEYRRIKEAVLKLVSTDPIFEIIKIILIFKILLVNPMDSHRNKVELSFLIGYANHHLDKCNSYLFKQQMSNYQLLQPMLHMLKISLDMMRYEQGHPQGNLQNSDKAKFGHLEADEIYSALIQYSDNLIKHFPFFNNINKLIRSSESLNEWFLKLNDLRSSMKKPTQQSSYLDPAQEQENARAQSAHAQAAHIATVIKGTRSQNDTPRLNSSKSYRSSDDSSDESEQELYIGSSRGSTSSMQWNAGGQTQTQTQTQSQNQNQNQNQNPNANARSSQSQPSNQNVQSLAPTPGYSIDSSLSNYIPMELPTPYAGYTPQFLASGSHISMADVPEDLLQAHASHSNQQPNSQNQQQQAPIQRTQIQAHPHASNPISMDGLDSFSQFPISASTRSLYNLFTHIDDFDSVHGGNIGTPNTANVGNAPTGTVSPTTRSMHNSLTNLFQFNHSYIDGNPSSGRSQSQSGSQTPKP